MSTPAAAETRLADLRARWQALSKAATRDSRLVALYARELAAAGAEPDAERLLRDALKREWTPELARAWWETNQPVASRSGAA